MRATVRRATGVMLGAALLLGVPGALLACVGDCNGNAVVTIDELTRGVLIGLGQAPTSTCEAMDNNRDGAVTIDEIVLAVTKALGSCALGPAGAVLLSTQGQELDQYDLATSLATTTIPSPRGQLAGSPCLLPGGAGNIAVGDQTTAAHGWSVFSPDGTFLAAVPPLPAAPAPGASPVQCAVDSASGRLFGVAPETPGGSDGELWVAFPPDYQQACELDGTLRAPAAIAAGADGALYVAEGVGGGAVLRIPGPFPADVAHCPPAGNTPPALTKSPFIAAQDDAIPSAVAQAPSGQWVEAVLGGTDGSLPGVREYDASGAFVRQVVAPGSGGDPGALAFDADGSLYYADLGLAAGSTQAVAGQGTLRTVTFAADGTPSVPELVAFGLSDPTGIAVVPSRTEEWLTLGGSLRRTFFNPFEHAVNAETAGDYILKWRYQTSGMINAQAAVVWLDLPNEGHTQVVIVPSWDQHVYALRAANGSRVWQFEMKPQPGTFYPYSGSPTVTWIDGKPRVYVPGGETMYCLDAVTGQEIWHFDAGTGCTDCTVHEERNEIESTPAIVNGMVLGAMDVNDDDPGNGGMFALSAEDGRLLWWFDLFTQSTCVPLATDNIRQFDGYHTAAELGLPADFLTARPGCNFDRTGYGCGNVWSSVAVDLRRGLLFIDSANCDTSTDPSSGEPPPPPPPFEEAIFALHLDGTPAWHWRPREIDNSDFDFGAVPNLFEATIGGQVRDLVGVGGKDGTYYVLDRDGTNALTGKVEPYWQTNVVPGGSAGGLIGSASVGEGVVGFCTAPGFSPLEPQEPTMHTLDLSTGAILWESASVDPCFGPTMGVPGLTFTGGTPIPDINIFSRADGALLKSFLASTVAGGISAGPTIVGDLLVVGGGTGAHNSGPDAEMQAVGDTPISAFCLKGSPGCAPNICNDGNPCTYDYPDAAGTCMSEPGADGINCTFNQVRGVCMAGVCVAATPGPTPTPGGD